MTALRRWPDLQLENEHSAEVTGAKLHMVPETRDSVDTVAVAVNEDEFVAVVAYEVGVVAVAGCYQNHPCGRLVAESYCTSSQELGQISFSGRILR